jgi:hypothetical protein
LIAIREKLIDSVRFEVAVGGLCIGGKLNTGNAFNVTAILSLDGTTVGLGFIKTVGAVRLNEDGVAVEDVVI